MGSKILFQLLRPLYDTLLEPYHRSLIDLLLSGTILESPTFGNSHMAGGHLWWVLPKEEPPRKVPTRAERGDSQDARCIEILKPGFLLRNSWGSKNLRFKGSTLLLRGHNLLFCRVWGHGFNLSRHNRDL